MLNEIMCWNLERTFSSEIVGVCTLRVLSNRECRSEVRTFIYHRLQGNQNSSGSQCEVAMKWLTSSSWFTDGDLVLGTAALRAETSQIDNFSLKFSTKKQIRLIGAGFKLGWKWRPFPAWEL